MGKFISKKNDDEVYHAFYDKAMDWKFGMKVR